MIRKATEKDIPAIQAMAQVVFRETYREILSSQQMDYMMDMMYSTASLERQMTEQGDTFFIEDGKGYVSYRFDHADSDGTQVYHLEKIYVMPSSQGTGLGLKLFNTIVEQVRQAQGQKKRIELNVNRGNRAVSFYEHLGMRRERSGDFPIGNGYYMNDYIMALDL